MIFTTKYIGHATPLAHKKKLLCFGAMRIQQYQLRQTRSKTNHHLKLVETLILKHRYNIAKSTEQKHKRNTISKCAAAHHPTNRPKQKSGFKIHKTPRGKSSEIVSSNDVLNMRKLRAACHTVHNALQNDKNNLKLRDALIQKEIRFSNQAKGDTKKALRGAPSKRKTI